MSSESALFAGISDEELRDLGQAIQRVDLQPGDVLFRQGDEANGLYVVGDGSLGAYSRLPGGREVELAVMGAGEVVGELALVDGGTRAATVRAVEQTTAYFLGRSDFLALVSRMDPTAFAIKRRLAAIVCERLRRRLDALAGSLTGDGVSPLAIRATADELVDVPTPDERYLTRLPFFRAFAPLQLPELLALSNTVHVPAHRILLREGDRSDVVYVTLNGAVEEVLGRGDRRIRVRLAGPGSAVAYVGLVDGGPSPVTVATRERALLLAIPASSFVELLDGATALSYAFVEAVQRDLIAALRQAERPQARLAASAGGAARR